MAVLETASELWLPHWIPRFWQALHEYRRYTGAGSVIDKMISPTMGTVVTLLSLALTGLIGWRERNTSSTSPAFARVLCLVLATTVLVAPSFAPYNQILLLPAMLILVRDGRTVWERSVAGRLVIALALFGTFWPWMTAVLLSVVSFALPAASVQQFWTVPFWTVWLIPVALAAFMLAVAYRESLAARKRISD